MQVNIPIIIDIMTDSDIHKAESSIHMGNVHQVIYLLLQKSQCVLIR